MSIAAIALSAAPIAAPRGELPSGKTPAKRRTIATADAPLVPEAR